MSLNNATMANYPFLKEMIEDDYFPNAIVHKGQNILIELCRAIEQQKPADLDALYALSHAATEAFNVLGEEFEENGSEIETAARDAIGTDFMQIATAYGFENADIEELIAPRDW
ncbi:DUF5713 family protein [Pseudomonas aegrilactucae]|uniref:Uncharacterized protein n=1 Tax=Pseudomonas aegrilactucae TaxID=2854028 RepID=A0A9Q2XK34_9PSED|nr:DUF5713 family protein [Pseudomonas aegrilactucae]MBV6288368.1 hypothetical protein [Pseudomonas aegrilactucae]